MALIAVAETAQDAGSALNKFLDPVADHSADITALIAQCFSTSSALRRLHKTIGDFPYHRRYSHITEDLTTVKTSLDYTFKDVQRLFGGLGKGVINGAAYRRVWRELDDHFYEESGNALSRRLVLYQQFLQDLTTILVERSPRDLDEFEETRDKIVRLLDAQEHRLADDLSRVSLGVPNIPKPPSFERTRPRGGKAPAQPQSPPPVSPRAGRRRPAVPRSPSMEYDFGWRRDRHPPFAPEIYDLDSPTTTSTNTFSSSQSSNTLSLANHWLPAVYEQSHPTTPLETTGQSSLSAGRDYGSEAIKRLAEEYVKLLEMPFENGDLLVRLYQRPEDYRSRLLIRTIRPSRSRKDSCVPLTHLEVERSGPFLKFSKISNRSSQLWAFLKFPSYERIVLFFCSFIALRSEDTVREVIAIADSELHGEKELFGGKIVDDHYQHALRLYRDKYSGGIRLQASVLRGDLKRTPVWTAFITHQVQSRTWMSRPSPTTIHLADLQRYVFTTEYTPQLAPSGEHELTFIKSSDATEFEIAIDDLFDE